MAAVADQDLEVDVEAEVEDEVEADVAVDVDVVPEELVLELVAAVAVVVRVAMVAPMPRNAVTLRAAANTRERAAACRRRLFRGAPDRGWRTAGPRPACLAPDRLGSTEVSFQMGFVDGLKPERPIWAETARRLGIG